MVSFWRKVNFHKIVFRDFSLENCKKKPLLIDKIKDAYSLAVHISKMRF